MYKRILVPLDGSPMGDRVLPYVGNLGRKLDAKVELFRDGASGLTDGWFRNGPADKS
jgi:hypothetical protein